MGIPFFDLGEQVLEWLAVALMWIATNTLAGAILVGDFVWINMVAATDFDYLGLLGGQYEAMAAIAAGFLLLATFAGLMAASSGGKPAEGLRRLLIDGPVAVVVMVTGLELGVVVLAGIGGLEQMVLTASGAGSGPFSAMEPLTEVDGEAGLVVAVPMIILAVLIMLISVLLGLFLMIRAALLALGLLYVPFMAGLLPSTYKSMLRLHVERLMQLGLSKFVILVAMGVGSVLMSQVTDVSDVNFVSPTPAEPNSSEGVEEAALGTILGIMFVGLGIVVAAAASPWFILSLLPGAHHDGSPLSGSDGGGSIAQARGVGQPVAAFGRRLRRR